MTDHQALSYAFKKEDAHGRLARWLDLFAEYGFNIIYQPGALNSAADYLSRYGESEKETDQETKDLNVQGSATIGGLEPYYGNIACPLTGLNIEEPNGSLGLR